MNDKEEIHRLIQRTLEGDEVISITLSSPRMGDISKAAVRPLLVKGKNVFQLSETRGAQTFHHNFSPKEMIDWLHQHLCNFKQSFFYTKEADYHLLTGKKENFTLLKKRPTKSAKLSMHNRKKEYLIEEGVAYPFLVSLGVMNREGKVYPAKQDKFRQINRFLEMVDDVLTHFPTSDPLHIIDFGCGKAYLTFALFHYLRDMKGYDVQMVGVDLKKEVIEYCRSLAEKLEIQKNLQFVEGGIKDYNSKGAIDLVVSLHACDTATDAALHRAVEWNARVILSVPCCQHELMPQIEQESLKPLLKHGILKERFAALATDAARGQLLEVVGYQVQILEFIDMEHTPKNLLIRAVRCHQTEERRKGAWESYLRFKEMLKIKPSLEHWIL